MFQYAIGRFLSIEYSVPLGIDTYYYNQYDHRTPTLFKHNIAAEKVDEQAIEEVLNYPKISKWMREGRELLETSSQSGLKLNLYYFPRFFPRFTARIFNYYREKRESDRFVTSHWAYRQRYNQAVLESGENAYLNGFWQSPKYFERVSETIKDDLTVTDPLPASNKPYERSIEQTTSVSIHIRRGDVARNESSELIPIKYFERAISHLSRTIDEPTFFVFSDDQEWAQDQLSIPYNTQFVSENDEKTDYLDLHLMKSCDHNIITNSTFSWWGAYLNNNEQKIVIVPDPWKRTKPPNNTIHDTDLIPKDWTFLKYSDS